jgi:thiamine-monophosphate kinase
MNKEDFFIKQFGSSSKLIGDDGAVVGDFVYSMDAFFEDVHFKLSWMSLKQIAKKAMLVNISDAIAMNAKPKYALLSVAIPPYFSNKDLKDLANGFKVVAKEFGIEIIGGDTIANDKLHISVTIVSKTKNPIYRSGVKNNDFLCYTGKIGDSKKDLDALLSGKKIDTKRSKFINPKLKDKFFYDCSKYINASMDISDGLCFELERLSKASKIGFEFLCEIPQEIGCSGEEYEIVFSFSKKDKKKIESLAKKHNVKLNIFAVAKRSKERFVCSCKQHHF